MPHSLLELGSGCDFRSASAVSSAVPSRSSSPLGIPSRAFQSRSRFTRCSAFTQAAPPSCNQTDSSQLPSAAVGFAALDLRANSAACRTRPSRTRASSSSRCIRSAISSGTGRRNNAELSSLTNLYSASSSSPHQGARKTPNQFSRSSGFNSARASANASSTSGRSLSGSRSTARKLSSASRRASAIGVSAFFVRPKIATRNFSPVFRASSISFL